MLIGIPKVAQTSGYLISHNRLSSAEMTGRARKLMVCEHVMGAFLERSRSLAWRKWSSVRKEMGGFRVGWSGVGFGGGG